MKAPAGGNAGRGGTGRTPQRVQLCVWGTRDHDEGQSVEGAWIPSSSSSGVMNGNRACQDAPHAETKKALEWTLLFPRGCEEVERLRHWNGMNKCYNREQRTSDGSHSVQL
jgi:hypothetical protein